MSKVRGLSDPRLSRGEARELFCELFPYNIPESGVASSKFPCSLSVSACPSSSSPPSSPLPVGLNLLVAFLCRISWRAAQHRCEPREASWPGRKERGPLGALRGENDRSLNSTRLLRDPREPLLIARLWEALCSVCC